MRKKDVLKYLNNKAYKYYKNGDLINYQYIKNCILAIKEDIKKWKK